MNSNEYRDFLLLKIPTASPASGGRVINCRCMECEDSTNPRHKHFYISIPQNSEEPSLYYCHKCHCSGMVTDKILLYWGIYDNYMASQLSLHNNSLLRLFKNYKYKELEIYQLSNNNITINSRTESKLNYINKRLGVSLTYDDLFKYKIALNLKDILKYNNIQNITRNPLIIDQLDNNFLGFISLDNAFINMRKLVADNIVYSSIDKRYINYSIFGKCNNARRFYTMPSIPLDLSIPRRIQLHIAEGPFDILSVYLNLRKDPTQIYTAIAGSGYKGIVREFINVIKLIYIEIHIYPDNDKSGSPYIMQDIANLVAPFNIPMYVHRNIFENEKDFGTDLSHIKESIERII